MNTRQTLEQRRAQHAWDKAAEGVAKHGMNYVNDAKGLPALIMNSGLMQVMAFLKKKHERHEMLLDHLLDWLQVQCGTDRDFTACMNAMLNATPGEYRHLTTEAMAWLRWLRQLAPARERGE